jgi:hypothetical protein
MTDLQTTTSPTEFDAIVADWSAKDFQILAVDLYRDIHKGIRAELFSITEAAGNADPSSAPDRMALADHVDAVAAVLASHAHHEDLAIDPVLDVHLPALAERISSDHERLEASFDRVVDLASSAVGAHSAQQRRLIQLLHLDLSSFTSEYLAHLVLEERVVMPALETAIGLDAVIAIHGSIVGSIPPEEMARTLAFMLPAMNTDDRVELLGGMREGAPQDVFEGVIGLAGSVLPAADFATLVHRLDLD